jgi:YteA family regulatory protein
MKMMNHLSIRQIDELRRQLLEEKQSLLRQLQATENHGLSLSQKEATGELSLFDNHPADVATEIYERGKDIALNEHAELQIQEIDRALQKIDEQEYGLCQTCRQPIPVERLKAVPTALYCKQHALENHVSNRRPAEEEFLHPPFGRTELDERDDQTEFDGEDAWQVVARYGTSNSPALSENPDTADYDEGMIEAEELDGFVEPLETFLATDLYGQTSTVVRNAHYYRYIRQQEGDGVLESWDTLD